MKLFTSDKSFYSKTVKLAVPITLQCLITIGVNMMDNIMVLAGGSGWELLSLLKDSGV